MGWGANRAADCVRTCRGIPGGKIGADDGWNPSPRARRVFIFVSSHRSGNRPRSGRAAPPPSPRWHPLQASSHHRDSSREVRPVVSPAIGSPSAGERSPPVHAQMMKGSMHFSSRLHGTVSSWQYQPRASWKFTPRTASPTWSTAPSAVLRCGRNQRRVLPPNLLHKRDAVGGQAKPRFVIDGRPAGTGTRHPARGEHPATATRSFVCGNGLFQSNVGNHRRTRRGKSPYPRFVVCEETRSPRRVTSQWLPPAKRRHSMPHSSRPHEAGVDRAIPSGGRWKTDPGTALLTAKFTSARLSAAGKSSGGVKVAASQEYLRY